jgi:hypothetical protein
LGQLSRIWATIKAISSLAPRSVDVRGPEFRRKQMPAAENIKRQIAVAFVIAVEEPAFLIAVDRIVSRVEIENDALWRGCVSLEKDADEQPFHRALVHAQLAIAVILCPWRVFEPVQCCFARQDEMVDMDRLALEESESREFERSYRSSRPDRAVPGLLRGSSCPQTIGFASLVDTAKLRWRIERGKRTFIVSDKRSLT